MNSAQRRKSIVAGIAGNFVEFYDWSIYAFTAPIFASQIFNGSSQSVSLLLAFSTFALGYVARPLGAILFGVYADRGGRRNAMSVAIVGTAACSLIIGLTPTYSAVGILSPIVILLARLLQGIAAGGEGGSATTYLAEFARPDRRAFTASFHQVSTGLSTLCALGTATWLSATLTPDELTTWGWRIPFFIGAGLGLFGLYLRLQARETPVFCKSAEGVRDESVLSSLTRAWRSVLLTAAIALLPSIAFQSWQIYLPTYVSETTVVSRTDALAVGVIGIVFFLVLILPSAMLSDRFGRKPMMIASGIGAVLWAYPTYVGLPTFANSYTGALVIAIGGNVILAAMAGSLIACMTEQFNTNIRATGNGLSYAIGTVIAGASYSPIVTALMSDRQYLGITAYVVVMAAISLVAYTVMPETRKRNMTAHLGANMNAEVPRPHRIASIS